MHELGAKLDRDRRSFIANGQDSATDAIASLEHDDVQARFSQPPRRRESSYASSDDDDVGLLGGSHDRVLGFKADADTAGGSGKVAPRARIVSRMRRRASR